ncbi:MAG: YtxH domain-containing protein [Candidatus Eremiobacteraeota bacterium]|nr:YtxH domain-containing protein [Candidatus Eremiobacteraeota bacterium]
MSNGNEPQGQGGGGFVAGFVVGALVGAALAVMLAPQAGEETRDLVWGKAREASNIAMDATGDLREKVTSVASDLQAGAADLYERGRTVVDGARSNVGSAVDEGRTAADSTRDSLSAEANSNS